MLSIQELKSDTKYKDIFSITQDEYKATELLAVNDGEIFQPLIVWKGQDVLVYGYHCWEILKAHPTIKYTLCEIEFQDWQEAQVWAIEHYIALPEVRLWQKLEAAVQCKSYWLLKEDAKKAHGNRPESPTVSEGNSDRSKEVNVIIGQKVGCSATYVYNFKRILDSGRKDIIALCRKGERTINAAYSQIFLPKKPKSAKPGPKTPLELEIDSSDIFDECEKNINIGKKNTTCHNGIPVNPRPIAEQMKTAKVPDGSIWITLHKKDGQLQVIKQTFDENKGVVLTNVNAYQCKIISTDDDVIIIEADRINGGTQEIQSKDESEFESSPRKAS